MDVVYLDFQKAFDKVPNQRLLLKLKAHGIGNGVINWIEKWLTHRRVDGKISNWKSVLSGVPQGSVLGPLLFLIYINDLEEDISNKILKFADDTKVFRKVTNDTDKQRLQDDLDKLVKWSEKWQMLFNFGKCKCIHIGHGNMDEEYKMGDAVLGRTTQEKGLGVTFSADIKVSEHCGIAASKGNQILGLIMRTIVYKEKQLIVPLYKAIVRPHLEYCYIIQAWRPYRKKDIDKLERKGRDRRVARLLPSDSALPSAPPIAVSPDFFLRTPLFLRLLRSPCRQTSSFGLRSSFGSSDRRVARLLPSDSALPSAPPNVYCHRRRSYSTCPYCTTSSGRLDMPRRSRQQRR